MKIQTTSAPQSASNKNKKKDKHKISQVFFFNTKRFIPISPQKLLATKKSYHTNNLKRKRKPNSKFQTANELRPRSDTAPGDVRPSKRSSLHWRYIMPFVRIKFEDLRKRHIFTAFCLFCSIL